MITVLESYLETINTSVFSGKKARPRAIWVGIVTLMGNLSLPKNETAQKGVQVGRIERPQRDLVEKVGRPISVLLHLGLIRTPSQTEQGGREA